MKTIGYTGAFCALLSWASSTAALPFNDVITGADMAGIQVTAFFNGASESATWATTSTDDSLPSGEGFAGQATGSGWSLAQQGYTLGNFDGGPLGAWTLTNNTGFNIFSLRIDALIADILFDRYIDEEYTPGSNVGRDFLTDGSVDATGSYSDAFSSPDLFGTLTIDFANGLADGASMQFLADTDAIASVPAPATLLLVAAGCLGLGWSARSGRSAAASQQLGYTS
ncbi:MAG: hypothetical protein ACK5HY_07825 [Parahaliea sp.]